jgi:hypothetical protein
MMALAERFDELVADAVPTNWRGRSGRFYDLDALAIEQFALTGGSLYLLARGADVLWVGSEDDVIGDAARRTAFRTALRVANGVYRIASPENDVDRMIMVWDLEGGEPSFRSR